MNEEAFNRLVDEIMSQGHDEDEAVRYAILIGDLPTRDAEGFVLVMTGDQVLTRLRPLKFFGAE